VDIKEYYCCLLGEQIGQNIKLTYKPLMCTHYSVQNFIIISY